MSPTNRSRAREFATLTDPAAAPIKRASTRPWLDRWMAFLRTIGNIQAWILFTVFYLVIILPIGLVFRCLTGSRRRHGGPASNWQPFAHSYERMDLAQEQS